MIEIPTSLYVDGHRLEVPVSPEVQEAFDRWLEERHHELVALYAPFGLHPYDLAAPRCYRVVTAKDVT